MSGHKYISVNPRPYMKTNRPAPVTCAYCGLHAGNPVHITKKAK